MRWQQDGAGRWIDGEGWSDVSQGKIVPLIAASAAQERARTDALSESVGTLALDVRELGRRLDELTDELCVFIGELRKDRKDRGNGGTP